MPLECGFVTVQHTVVTVYFEMISSLHEHNHVSPENKWNISFALILEWENNKLGGKML